MPLESLLELVKTLSDRIDRHGAALRQSEALTRYALIDPLLRELGWDTEDPDMVIPEYRSGNGRADYALMNDGSPAMMVEAKSLGTPLQDSVLAQGINYCLMEGTSYFSVTDGRLWEIYETHKPVPINEKRIVQFDLKGDISQACLKALALWRNSVQTSQVQVGVEPLLEIQPQTEIQQIHPSAIREQTISSFQAAPLENEDGWQRLTEFTPTKGQNPIGIMFPDNGRAEIGNWASIPVEVVRWLTNRNILSTADCPIMGKNPRSFRYMVHTRPVHSNGDQFTSPHEVNGLYVERHDNRVALRNKTVTIIEQIGQDPSQFKVRLP
ncbi:MAG: hypothetical protein F4Y49_06830 [Dehalococcoidia bacterium]|nr:hypothetical protein [Dehalococcoidia bacterium]